MHESADLSVNLQTIGIVHSCFTEKFGIPRQPGLAPHATGVIELLPPFNCMEIVRDLHQYSHIWLLYIFHKSVQQAWKSTVRPPRLGGNQRMSVFATRSNFRPNPIGLSVVALDRIEHESGQVRLHISGLDLLDQTPIIDIKPYVPFSDCLPDAVSHFAQEAPAVLPVVFSALALQQCEAQRHYPNLQSLISEVLQQDPRPAYQDIPEREYGICLYDLNIRWTVKSDTIQVLQISPLSPLA